MISSEMERLMRDREVYSRSVIPLGRWPILRVDGIGFTRYTAAAGYEKPFDPNFHSRMVASAMYLLVRLEGVYATTHSDEISVVLRPGTDLFGRRAEKLASVAAGRASTHFGEAFDGRVSVASYPGEVVDYFAWRQADASSNALSSLTYWTLRKNGKSQGDATAILKGVGSVGRVELLAGYGVDPGAMPSWMRRGIGLSWQRVVKPGWNPVLEEETVAVRSIIVVDSEVPTGDAYAAWLAAYLEEEVKRNE